MEKYPYKELDSLEKKAQENFRKIQIEMFEGIRASLSIEDFKKSILCGEPLIKGAKGSMRANHKYILRTGSPGNYTYYYMENGQLRSRNDFSKDVDKFKKQHGEMPFTNGFNHPGAIKEYMKRYPDIMPNTGEAAKHKKLLKVYLNNLRGAANQSIGEDRTRILQEIKTLKGRFITGEGIKTLVAKPNGVQKITVKPKIQEPVADNKKGFGNILQVDDGVQESGGGIRQTDAGSGEIKQEVKSFAQGRSPDESAKYREARKVHKMTADNREVPDHYLEDKNEAIKSELDFTPTTDLNLVSKMNTGLASPEVQQQINDGVNILESVLKEAGLGSLNRGIEIFCGKIEGIQDNYKGEYQTDGTIQILSEDDFISETVVHEFFHAIDDALTKADHTFRTSTARGETQKIFEAMFAEAKDTEFMTSQIESLEVAADMSDNIKDKKEAAKTKEYLNKRTEIFARLGEVYIQFKVKEMIGEGKIDKEKGEKFLSQFQSDLLKDQKFTKPELDKMKKNRDVLYNKQMSGNLSFKDEMEIGDMIDKLDRDINHAQFGMMPLSKQEEFYQKIKPHMENLLSTSKVYKALVAAGIIEPLIKAGSIFGFIKNLIKRAYLKTLIMTLGIDALNKEERNFIRQDLELSDNIFEQAYQMGSEDNLISYDRSEAKSFIKKLFKSLDSRVIDILKNSRNEESARNKLFKLSTTAQSSYGVIVADQMTRSYNEGRIAHIQKTSEQTDPLVYCLGPLDNVTSEACKKHYHEGGSYKVYRLSELFAGGDNAYQPKSSWTAVIPPMHPNCRHVLVELPKGWSLDNKGKPYFVGPNHDELDNNLMEKSLKGKVPTFSGWKLHKKYRFQGMNISIENQKGSYRKWRDVNGTEGKTKMLYDYGYIRNTLSGADGDHIDCYVGPNEDATNVYVVHQIRVDIGKFDEDKVMLGFDSAKDAKEAYLAHYNSNKFFGSMDTFDLDAFKKKVIGKRTIMIKGAVRGSKRANAKYLRREGVSPNYIYYYKEDDGSISVKDKDQKELYKIGGELDELQLPQEPVEEKTVVVHQKEETQQEESTDEEYDVFNEPKKYTEGDYSEKELETKKKIYALIGNYYDSDVQLPSFEDTIIEFMENDSKGVIPPEEDYFNQEMDIMEYGQWGETINEYFTDYSYQEMGMGLVSLNKEEREQLDALENKHKNYSSMLLSTIEDYEQTRKDLNDDIKAVNIPYDDSELERLILKTEEKLEKLNNDFKDFQEKGRSSLVNKDIYMETSNGTTVDFWNEEIFGELDVEFKNAKNMVKPKLSLVDDSTQIEPDKFFQTNKNIIQNTLMEKLKNNPEVSEVADISIDTEADEETKDEVLPTFNYILEFDEDEGEKWERDTGSDTYMEDKFGDIREKMTELLYEEVASGTNYSESPYAIGIDSDSDGNRLYVSISLSTPELQEISKEVERESREKHKKAEKKRIAEIEKTHKEQVAAGEVSDVMKSALRGWSGKDDYKMIRELDRKNSLDENSEDIFTRRISRNHRYLKEGWDNLPNYKGKVSRNIFFKSKEELDEFVKAVYDGKGYKTQAFASFSGKDGKFTGGGSQYSVSIEVEDTSLGKGIWEYSQYMDEKEVLFPKNVFFDLVDTSYNPEGNQIGISEYNFKLKGGKLKKSLSSKQLDVIFEAFNQPLSQREEKVEKALRGSRRPGSKYLRREGEPGSYVYYYSDDNGGYIKRSEDGSELGRVTQEEFNALPPLPNNGVPLPAIPGKTSLPGLPGDTGPFTAGLVSDNNESNSEGIAVDWSAFKEKVLIVSDKTKTGVKPMSDEEVAQGERINAHGPYDLGFVNKFNKHLEAPSKEAYEKFIANDFNEIEAGVMGKKGIVEVNGTKYFIKSSKMDKEEGDGDRVYNNLKALKGAFPSLPEYNSNNSEIIYNNVINNVFPKLADYYVSKIKLSKNAYLSDAVDDAYGDLPDKMKHIPVEVALTKMVKNNPSIKEDLTKLAFLNSLLGNIDRHIGNIIITKDDELKLIDEGIAFQINNAGMVKPHIPAYINRSGADFYIGKDFAESFLTDDTKNAIMANMGNDKSLIKEFGERWDNLRNSVLNNESEQIDVRELIETKNNEWFGYFANPENRELFGSNFAGQEDKFKMVAKIDSDGTKAREAKAAAVDNELNSKLGGENE